MEDHDTQPVKDIPISPMKDSTPCKDFEARDTIGAANQIF